MYISGPRRTWLPCPICQWLFLKKMYKHSCPYPFHFHPSPWLLSAATLLHSVCITCHGCYLHHGSSSTRAATASARQGRCWAGGKRGCRIPPSLSMRAAGAASASAAPALAFPFSSPIYTDRPDFTFFWHGSIYAYSLTPKISLHSRILKENCINISIFK